MSRLFNNKWFVLGLAAFSFYFVISKAVLPYIGNDMVYSEPIDMPGMGADNIFGSKSPPIKPVQISQLYWKEDPVRDPFSLNLLRIKSKKESLKGMNKLENQRNEKSSANHLPIPHLTGFVSGKQSKLVVFNDGIVGLGQLINGYKIIAINSKGVSLRRLASTKTIVLTLE